MLPRKQAIGIPGALRGDTTTEPMHVFLWMEHGAVLSTAETFQILCYNKYSKDIRLRLTWSHIGDMFLASPAVVFLPCFLEVVASVDVHLLDHGPMWDLQENQNLG